MLYYTALFNAVEHSVHLHGPSRLPVVNYFSIMTVAMHTAVKESHVSHITTWVVLQSEARHLCYASVSCSPCQELFPDNDRRRSIHYLAYYTATCQNEKITSYGVSFFYNLFVTSIRSVDQQRKSQPKTLTSLSNRIRWGWVTTCVIRKTKANKSLYYIINH